MDTRRHRREVTACDDDGRLASAASPDGTSAWTRDIDGIVPDPAFIDPDTAATIGLAIVGAASLVVFVILLPALAIGTVVGAIIIVVAGEAIMIGGVVTSPGWAPRLSPVFSRRWQD
jgi:hypothetical protein